MNKKIHLILVIILCVSAAVYAAWQMTWTTAQGIGVSPDSTIYLVTAENVQQGRGFSFNGEPMTHYPPGYPLALVFGGLFSPDLDAVARWMNVALYALNGLLFGWIAYKATQKNLLGLLAALLLFYTSKAVLTLHAWAWSEPLYLLLTFLTILLFDKYFSTVKPGYLVASALVLALTITVRYLGIALLPPLLLILLLHKQHTRKKRWGNLAAVTTLSILPLLAWFLRNILLTSHAANRVLNFHPLSSGKYHNAVETLYKFLSPDTAAWLVHLSILLIFVVLMIAVFLGLREQGKLSIPGGGSGALVALACGLYVLTYLTLLVISVTFFDASTPLDERLLAPLYLFTSLMTLSALRIYAQEEGKKLVWVACLLAAFVSAGLNISPLLQTATENHTDGMGFNATKWVESPILTELTKVDSNITIYSNGSDAILYKTGRQTSYLPAKYASTSMIKNGNYKAELNAMCSAIIDGRAVLVYLDNIAWRRYFAKEDELTSKCNLPVLMETSDGTIYGTNSN